MVRFLLSDVEMISSHRIILFTCIKNRGVEIFNIDRIRFNLRFQTEIFETVIFIITAITINALSEMTAVK